ncbi:MAG: LPP20 family lipoprotein [Rickettsiales bacterium]|nr:LPP20 family lipoprotein [Rickettsiales bacterium]
MIKFVCLFMLYGFILISSGFAEKLPEWVRNVDKECKKGDICAVGSGKSLNLAQIDARNNIQKIFETKVNSTFVSEISSRNDRVESSANEVLQEESVGVLKGVSIIKTFEDNGEFYVLAALNKNMATNNLKVEIKHLDEDMKILLKDKSAVSHKRLENNYNTRMKLNDRHLFLTGKGIPETVKYSDVVNKKKENKDRADAYFLEVNNEDVKTIIKGVLGDNNVKVTKRPGAKTIKSRVSTKKEFLNVDGFEKHSLKFEMSLIENGVVTNTLSTTITETGTNFEQAYTKALDKLTKFVSDNFTNFID